MTIGLLAFFLLAVWPAHAADVESVELELSSDRLVLHEQLVVSVRVRHLATAKPRWQAPAFEGFWTERLRAEGGPLSRNSAGETVHTTTFRRALFPTRDGALRIEPSKLLARNTAGDEYPLPVGGASVHVSALPEAGRPAAYSELVGQLNVRLAIDKAELELGRALPLTLDVFGEANVWDTEPPDFQVLLGDRVEVFPSRPRMIKTEHRGTLRARRRYEVELVPRELGSYTIPVIAIPYFDTETQLYREARSEAVTFRVVPRGKVAARRPWEERREVIEPLATGALAARALGVLALLGLGGLGMLWWWRRTLRLIGRDPPPRPRVLLERARTALGSPEFTPLLRDALKAGIHVRHGFDPKPLTTEEIAVHIDDGAAVALLETLDRARFTRAEDGDEQLFEQVSRYVLS